MFFCILLAYCVIFLCFSVLEFDISNIAFYLTLVAAWDCSAWVRTYALFLEERLECFRVLTYDIEAERLPKPAQGQEKV